MLSRRMIGTAGLVAGLCLVVAAAPGATLNFDWPAGAGGFYEISGQTGRLYDDATVTVPDGASYRLAGAGFNVGNALVVDGAGNASLSGMGAVGIQDNGGNNFEWLARTVNITNNGFWGFTQVRSVTPAREQGSYSQSLVYAPGHTLDMTGSSVGFGVDAAGDVTIGAGNPHVVSGSPDIVLNTREYVFDPGGSTAGGLYEISSWGHGRASGVNTFNGLYGKYGLSIFGDTTVGQDVYIDENYQLSLDDATFSGSVAIPFVKGGQEFDLTITLVPEEEPIPEPATLALVGLGGIVLLRRRRKA